VNPADTIVAIASPPGGAARAVVRMSGTRAFELAGRWAPISERERRASRFVLCLPGELRLPAAVWTFPEPRSYTGEDVVEIHLPGSPPVVRLLVDSLIDAGARPAAPGEFTLRAFLSGRMDLAQAESVQSLIMARDADEVRAARGRLEGDLSRILHTVENELLDLSADMEASLDFVEEDIRILPEEEAVRRLEGPRERLRGLLGDVRVAEESRPTVLLWGAPNVGKSLLFNRLTGGEAIVSTVPGTTRDVLEGEMEGVRLLDAAGVHEARGVDADAVVRARRACGEADLVLSVVDATRPEVLPPPVERPGLRVVNKSDLRRLPGELCVSALTGEGIAELREAVRTRTRGCGGPGARFHVSLRQQGWLRQAMDALDRVPSVAGMELRAADVRAALDALGAVTGRAVGEEVLHRIFSRFCVGK